ncbi:DUF6440 family protein [Dysosmobacter sp.]
MARRFVKTYTQGIVGSGCEVYVDRETGVNYLFIWSAGGGGLTPLLDQDGRPVITAAFDGE